MSAILSRSLLYFIRTESIVVVTKFLLTPRRFEGRVTEYFYQTIYTAHASIIFTDSVDIAVSRTAFESVAILFVFIRYLIETVCVLSYQVKKNLRNQISPESI